MKAAPLSNSKMVSLLKLENRSQWRLQCSKNCKRALRKEKSELLELYACKVQSISATCHTLLILPKTFSFPPHFLKKPISNIRWRQLFIQRCLFHIIQVNVFGWLMVDRQAKFLSQIFNKWFLICLNHIDSSYQKLRESITIAKCLCIHKILALIQLELG